MTLAKMALSTRSWLFNSKLEVDMWLGGLLILFSALGTEEIDGGTQAYWFQVCSEGRSEGSGGIEIARRGNGILRMPSRGLEWKVCPEGVSVHQGRCSSDVKRLKWQAAKEYVKEEYQNTQGGDSVEQNGSWRLPTIREMSWLVEPSCTMPALNVNVVRWSGAERFWTQTEGRVGGAYAVNLATGMRVERDDSEELALRLVRRITPYEESGKGKKVHTRCGKGDGNQRFVKDGHTVADRVYSRTWRRCLWGRELDPNGECRGSPAKVSWGDATAQFDGTGKGERGSAWRLPTLTELRSIVALECEDVMNRRMFPARVPVWTSTAFAGNRHRAWFIDLKDGSEGWARKTEKAALLLVR